MYKLEINTFRIWLNLGYSENERKQVQPVDISIVIKFKHPPQGCFDDQLTGVVDYTNLVKDVRGFVAERSFKLIEHVAFNLHSLIENIISMEHVKLIVKVHKINPAIDGLNNGVSFTYSKI